jgi:microcystin degradation protein MlrC
MSTRRIALGGIIHETNTFAPGQTTLADFVRQGMSDGAAMVERMGGTPTALGGSLQGLAQAGYQAVPLLYATAMPSAMVTRETYESLRDDLLARLRTALPVDGVLLALHGAMVAEGYDDCEGDILARVRTLVGSACPVVSTLDMHGNLSQAMVDAANVLVAYDMNPHLDTFERGVEAAQILCRILDQHLRTAAAMARPPLLLSALTTWTARPPLCTVHARGQALERDPRVVNVGVMGGFAYADTPFSGMSVMVTTTGDMALAKRLAQELADIAWAERKAAAYVGVPVAEAVARATGSTEGLTMLADAGDNVGGGSPGDGTAILAALLAARAQGAVVTLADGEAVAGCVRARVGATVEIPVGGKCDTSHGEPVRVSGVVERLNDGQFTIEGIDHFAGIYGRNVHMGRCAVLRCGGVRLLLTERKTPPGNLAQLRSQGIVPEEQRIIVVKSAVAFRGAYEPIARDIIEVDTPGICASNLERFSYHKLPRPIYPLDPIG